MRRFMLWPLMVLAVLLGLGPAFAQSYLLKPGDTLSVTVFQDEKLNRQIVVAPDGRVSFPLAGHFRAAGRTLEAVEAELKFRLKKQYTDDVDITVAVANIREEPLAPEPPPEEQIFPTFYITGGVNKPGQYAFRTRTNVLQALALAGGVSPLAIKNGIKIRRKVDGGETFYRFDYEAFLSGGDAKRNISLRDGDVIIVPERDKDALDPSFYVTGEVARPGQYFFKTRTTVLQAIAIAGGLGPFAAESRIVIRRKKNGEDTLYEFDYEAYVEGEDVSSNMRLMSGDVIVVPEKGIFE